MKNVKLEILGILLIILLYQNIGISKPIKSEVIGYVININSPNDIIIKINQHHIEKRLKLEYDDIIDEGNSLYIIKPGFHKVILKIENELNDNYIKARIISGTTNGLKKIEAGVYYKIDRIKNNYNKFTELKNNIKSIAISSKYARELMDKANEFFKDQNKIWDGIEYLLKVIKSKVNKNIKAEAYFKLANAFYREFSKYNNRYHLYDYINFTEIINELINNFSQNNYWVERAYYNLAFFTTVTEWKEKNSLSYRYYKKSGRFGKLFFDFGKNILETMEKDSILLLEGGYNQTIVLQMLLQLEKIRPDITVYNQKGHIFDQIYGDIEDLNQEDLLEKQVKADKILIKNRKPPDWTKIRSFVNKKKAFRKRKGNIYYTWKDYKRLDKINNIFKANNKPTYHFEQIGILYQIMQDGRHINDKIKNNIWRKYKLYNNKKKCENYPYYLSGIIVNTEFQHGDYFFQKAVNKFKLYLQDKTSSKKQSINYKYYKKYLNEAFKKYRNAKRFAKDLPALHFNLSLLLEQHIKILEMEDDKKPIPKILDEIIINYKKSAEIFINCKNENKEDQNISKAYTGIGNTYIKKAYLNKTKEKDYIKKAIEYFNEAIEYNQSNDEAKKAKRAARVLLKSY